MLVIYIYVLICESLIGNGTEFPAQDNVEELLLRTGRNCRTRCITSFSPNPQPFPNEL